MKRSESSPASAIGHALRAGVLAPIRLYQRFVSPALPRRCKYYPTCSAYAVDAIRELGVVRGLIVAAWRLVRCNPLSHGGYDPIENRTIFRSNPPLPLGRTHTTGPLAASLPRPVRAGRGRAEESDRPHE